MSGVRSLLRRLAGPDPRLAELEAERDSLASQVAHLQETLKASRASEAGAQRVADKMLREPAQGECTKTRLHTREEAEAFAAAVAERLGRDPAGFGVYKCRACPRHPHTTERFFHIGNRDAALSGDSELKREGAVAAKRARLNAGRQTIDRAVTPEALASLRQRFGGAS